MPGGAGCLLWPLCSLKTTGGLETGVQPHLMQSSLPGVPQHPHRKLLLLLLPARALRSLRVSELRGERGFPMCPQTLPGNPRRLRPRELVPLPTTSPPPRAEMCLRVHSSLGFNGLFRSRGSWPRLGTVRASRGTAAPGLPLKLSARG